MSFPTNTTLLDDFSGTLGNWTNSQFGDGALTILSGQVAGTATPGWGGGVWTSGFNADCECYITISTLGAAGHNMAIWARVTNSGGSPTGYNVQITSNTGAWLLQRVSAGASLSLASGSTTISAGDKVGIQAFGTAISAWIFHGGAWSQLGSNTNSDIVAAGKIGLECFGQTYRLDDFTGGNYIATSTDIPGPAHMVGAFVF